MFIYTHKRPIFMKIYIILATEIYIFAEWKFNRNYRLGVTAFITHTQTLTFVQLNGLKRKCKFILLILSHLIIYVYFFWPSLKTTTTITVYKNKAKRRITNQTGSFLGLIVIFKIYKYNAFNKTYTDSRQSLW